MLLRLTEDGAQLQPEFALETHAAIPGRQLSGGHKAVLAQHVDALLQVLRAVVQHRQLLKAHRHIVAGDELNVLVALRSVQIHYFQNAFRLLEQNEGLLVLVSHCKVVGAIC